MPPVFINCRDRVTALIGMVDWLERAGADQITLIDNASTYPPLLEFYERTPHTVVLLGENAGHMALFWTAPDLIPAEGGFFYSDPDLVFLGPPDGLERLIEVAARHPERDKIGFGLHLGGVPETMPSIDWERSMWDTAREIEPGVFDSPIDTTFAFYNRPATDIWNSLRVGPPHVMAHPSWLIDPANLSEEDAYYLAGASDASSWARGLRARGDTL